MTFTIRPAVRIDTPLIIGLAGPSKSGKTYSAHRLARGLAKGGVIVMINAEGARGHQYADRFKYQALDIEPPYSYARYDEALQAAAALNPACVIVDSISHAHDGPGGMIEEHDAEVERRAGGDFKKAERVTWAAWIKPKQAEGKFIYRMLGMNCPIILCFRAKEKIKIVPGKDPVDLGYQPIASDRISFETIFSLMLPPRSKGVPDLVLSELREPFDTMITAGEPIDENLGERLAVWATGLPPQKVTAEQVATLRAKCKVAKVEESAICARAETKRLEDMPAELYASAAKWLDRKTSADTGKVHVSGAPEPITDEAQALSKIERSRDAGEASAILDLCAGQPFYDRAAQAVRAQFP
jgi:hypothetical protein